LKRPQSRRDVLVSRESFALRDGPNIELDAAGFLHPRTARSTQTGFTRYVEITHVASSERGIWIATEDDLIVVPGARFEEADAPARLRAALLQRIANLAGGEESLERMAALEAVGADEGTPHAVRALAILCGVAFVLEFLFHPEVVFVGEFSPRLAEAGEIWRIATGNLLHGNLMHLVANLFGLLVLGRIVERDLGSVRTLGVMGVSAASAMLLSGFLADSEVVGVSGVVLGLGGALVWVELFHRNEQPAWWRFPRGLRHLLLFGLVFDMLLGFTVPFIAGAAHMGGLLGGAAATAWFTRNGLRAPLNAPARVLAVGVVALTVGSIVWAGGELYAGNYVARHIAQLTELPDVSADELNKVAWLTAIDDDATRIELQAALLLAERAVLETNREHPTVLDTQAEVLFHLGRPLDAIRAWRRRLSACRRSRWTSSCRTCSRSDLVAVVRDHDVAVETSRDDARDLKIEDGRGPESHEHQRLDAELLRQRSDVAERSVELGIRGEFRIRDFDAGLLRLFGVRSVGGRSHQSLRALGEGRDARVVPGQWGDHESTPAGVEAPGERGQRAADQHAAAHAESCVLAIHVLGHLDWVEVRGVERQAAHFGTCLKARCVGRLQPGAECRSARRTVHA
jgi:membrane associated rhomboid family serine protease